MRVIRVIMYESDDQAKLDRQLCNSLQDGQYDLATKITILTVTPEMDRCNGSFGWMLNHWLDEAAKIKQSLSGPPVGDPSIFDDKEPTYA